MDDALHFIESKAIHVPQKTVAQDLEGKICLCVEKVVDYAQTLELPRV